MRRRRTTIYFCVMMAASPVFASADLGQSWQQFRARVQQESVRQAKNLEAQSNQLRKRVEDAKLDEKRALIQEFWRIRKSVDFLALMDEEVLEAVTGLDRATVSRISATMRTVASLLAIR